MKRAILLTLAAAGCARVPPPQTMLVELGLDASQQCRATVDGRDLPLSDASYGQFAKRRVLILSHRDVPYRCAAGLIGAVQKAGAARVNFRALEQASASPR